MQLLSYEGWLFLLRWTHFMAGIVWIGILYYFNLVQTPFFAETDPPVRSGAIQKLVPRALWWFRWGAMVTFLSGWLIILHRLGADYGWAGWWASSYGWTITLGGILGTMMWANVWFVIWPNQQVVIANAVQTAKGGAAIPDAAARGRRAALASRTNVVFSIPMLFYMGAASHLNLVRPTAGGKAWMAILAAIIIALVEINALVGSQGATKKPLDTIPGTLSAGFVLALVFYFMFEIFMRGLV